MTSYASTVPVKAQGKDKALVVWQGSFKRLDLAVIPATGQDDETAIKTMTSEYYSGLDNLKNSE